jgi:hypothetical protein
VGDHGEILLRIYESARLRVYKPVSLPVCESASLRV